MMSQLNGIKEEKKESNDSNINDIFISVAENNINL